MPLHHNVALAPPSAFWGLSAVNISQQGYGLLLRDLVTFFLRFSSQRKQGPIQCPCCMQAERALKAGSDPARQALQTAAERLPSTGLMNDADSLPARQSYHTSLLAAGGHDPDWRPLRSACCLAFA